MTESKAPQGQTAPVKKSYCWLWSIIIFFVGIILLIVLYFGGAWVLRKVNKNIPESENTSQTTGAKIDPNLINQWDTGCLVPDPNSQWAERHTFDIRSDGTATHKRYSGDSCEAMAIDNTDAIYYKIPSDNTINLSYSSGIANGTTIYDIYQVSGDTLKFGHGFCNCSTGGNLGMSESDRFTGLNNFLLYKKQ